ncbi:TRAP transporter substrate-binding protein [Bosea vaviloviae]|uniref:C4-dicarboxylate ABC transporter n=1 Tax=Bosea vaviloviae TaxID=1526658 RepID=A0A1D7UC44_9HYPH|nr:TRAP transporter substrate-binding protein [Bosea vaviloviae]AOO84939.1 C4-dicarboxylate ABC transporter [Bosea vaviloviae]
MIRISSHALTGFAGAIALLLCPAISPAQSQEKPIHLKISLFVPPAHPLVPSAKEWAESLKKASGGSITATIFPAEQLGKAFDQYDMVSNGIADVALVSPGYQPGRFPIINAAQLPFMVANADGGSAAVDDWYRQYAQREMSDTHFCMAFVHDPGTLHSRKKVVLPGDVRGLKVRPAQQAIGELITTLGGTNIQASAPESRDALERGVADAITFPWNSIFLFGIDKVTKYSLDAPLYTTSYTWSLNKAVYDRASAAQKKVMDDHCTAEWAVRISHAWTVFEEEGRQKMRKASGHEITELSPDQLKQWRNAAAPLAMSWANAVRAKGLDPDAVLTELRQKLSDRKAIY